MTAIPLGVELHLPKAPVGGMCPAINGYVCFVSLKCPLLPTSLECRELALHYTWIKFICHRTGVGIWCPNGLGCIAYYRVIMGQFIGIHQIIININWCFTARYSDVGRIYSSCIIQCAANKYKQNIITMITHIWSIQSPPPLPKLSGQNPFHDYQLQSMAHCCPLVPHLSLITLYSVLLHCMYFIHRFHIWVRILCTEKGRG